MAFNSARIAFKKYDMFEAQQPIWPTDSFRCALGSLGSTAFFSTSGIQLQTNGERWTCLWNVWSDRCNFVVFIEFRTRTRYAAKMVCLLWRYVSFSASIRFDIYLGFGRKLLVRDLTRIIILTFMLMSIPFFMCLGKKRGKSYVSGMIYFAF